MKFFIHTIDRVNEESGNTEILSLNEVQDKITTNNLIKNNEEVLNVELTINKTNNYYEKDSIDVKLEKIRKMYIVTKQNDGEKNIYI